MKPTTVLIVKVQLPDRPELFEGDVLCFRRYEHQRPVWAHYRRVSVDIGEWLLAVVNNTCYLNDRELVTLRDQT